MPRRSRAPRHLIPGLARRAFLLLCLAILAGNRHANAAPIDPDATEATRALFVRLDSLRKEHLLFGHQHSTEYGIGWTATGTEDSDVKRTTGQYPAVYGWDFYDPKQTTTGDGPTSMRAHVLAAHARGGISTFSWHDANPVSGGNVYDKTAAVSALLPGGEKHDQFRADLDAIADFFLGLRDESGALIPVIFRPWHEHNGDWFWWGTPHHCTPDEFVSLWRFTVDYLRSNKNVHSVLYAWSPNWSWKDEYFVGYPGDDYVDVFGLDAYAPSLTSVLPRIREMVERAEARGKIPAITEAGYPEGLSKCKKARPFTKLLLAPLRDDPVAKRVAWILLWRNAAAEHFWVPPPEHRYADDFRAFEQDPYTLFGDTRLPQP